MGRIDPGLIDSGLADTLRVHISDPLARHELQEYFGVEPAYGFDGRRYNELGDSDPNHFTPEDIVAVSALSVPIPIAYAWRVLRTDAEQLNDLLRQIPTQLDLWDASEDEVGRGSPADRLWDSLRSLAYDGGDDGDSWVTAGKLLARKRPRLIPIYDRKVRDLVSLMRPPRTPDGGQRRASWWYSLRAALAFDDHSGPSKHPAICERIDEMRTNAGIKQSISTLRTLDVILWMRATRESRSGAITVPPSAGK